MFQYKTPAFKTVGQGRAQKTWCKFFVKSWFV